MIFLSIDCLLNESSSANSSRITPVVQFSFTKRKRIMCFQSKTYSPIKCSTSKSSTLKKKISVKHNSPKSPKTKSNICKKKSPVKYDEWIHYRYECEQLLMKFIIQVYQNIWQNEWKLMLEINTENATLKDMIRLIRKEWFSNFSDIFNRNPDIKLLIDNLHSKLQNGTNHQLLINDLKQLMNILEESKYFCNTSDETSFKKRKTI